MLTDSMTLEEKLAAIDKALADAAQAIYVNKAGTVVYAPADPSELFICDSCQ